jgi:hypothetical protein
VVGERLHPVALTGDPVDPKAQFLEAHRRGSSDARGSACDEGGHPLTGAGVVMSCHLIAKDIRNTARCIHDGLRLEIRQPAPTGQLLPQGSHIPVTAQSSRVILPDRSLHT